MSEGDKFEFALPVWTIIDGNIFKKQGLLPSIVPLTSPDVGRFIAICTDFDLAKRLIEDFVPIPGTVPLKFIKQRATGEIIEALSKAGWTHVGIDVSKLGKRILGRFYPIQSVIDVLKS